MANYTLKVDDVHEFHVSSNEVDSMDILTQHSDHYHVIDNANSYNIQIIAADIQTKTYVVKVDDVAFNITIHNELDVLINDMGMDTRLEDVITEINAPMPGMVLKVLIEPGRHVKENESMLILEAMKMENIISSPRDGVIKSIEVNEGDAVTKSQLLIRFED